MIPRKRIGAILRQLRIIDDSQLKKGLEFQKGHNCRIGEALIELECLTDVQLAQALARQYNLPYVDPSKGEIPQDVIALIPKDIADKINVIPIRLMGEELIVGTDDPTKINEISVHLNSILPDYKLLFAVCPHRGLDDAYIKYKIRPDIEAMLWDMIEQEQKDKEEFEKMTEEYNKIEEFCKKRGINSGEDPKLSNEQVEEKTPLSDSERLKELERKVEKLTEEVNDLKRRAPSL